MVCIVFYNYYGLIFVPVVVFLSPGQGRVWPGVLRLLVAGFYTVWGTHLTKQQQWALNEVASLYQQAVPTNVRAPGFADKRSHPPAVPLNCLNKT
jgi:hypothetical protein